MLLISAAGVFWKTKRHQRLKFYQSVPLRAFWFLVSCFFRFDSPLTMSINMRQNLLSVDFWFLVFVFFLFAVLHFVVRGLWRSSPKIGREKLSNQNALYDFWFAFSVTTYLISLVLFFIFFNFLFQGFICLIMEKW